jgi:hypothetical protein
MPKRAAVSTRDLLRAKRTKYTTKDEDVARAQEFRIIVYTRNAIRMQRYRTHKLATDAATHGMTCEIAKTISFTDLTARMNDPLVVRTMKLILHRVWVLTARGSRELPGTEKTKNVRTKNFSSHSRSHSMSRTFLMT